MCRPSGTRVTETDGAGAAETLEYGDESVALRLESLRALRERIDDLGTRQPEIRLALVTAERRVSAGTSAAGVLDEPLRWFEAVRTLLDEVAAQTAADGSSVATGDGSLGDARSALETAERDLLQAVARHRAEAARAQRRRQIIEEARRQLDQLGDDDPDEVMRHAGLSVPPSPAAAPHVDRVLPPVPMARSAPDDLPPTTDVDVVVDEDVVDEESLDDEDPPPPQDLGIWSTVITALVDQGRDDLAWLTAEANDQPLVRQRVLAFFATAMRCGLDRLEGRLPDVLPDENPDGRDEAAVLLAACLRFGLDTGYSPVGLSPLVERADIQHAPLRAIVSVAVEAVHHGGRRSPAGEGGYDDLLKGWAELGPRALALKELLSRATVFLPRASNVMHHLARDNERLGRALVDLADLASAGPSAVTGGDPRLDGIKDVAHILGSTAAVKALITAADQALSSPQQLKRPIQARARTRLVQLTEQVRALLVEALALAAKLRQARRPAELFDMDELRKAGESYEPLPEPRTIGEAALHRLALWIGTEPGPTNTLTPREVRRNALRLAYEIERDADGDPAERLRPHHLHGILHGRTVEEAVGGFLDRGNVRAARDLLGDEESEVVERRAEALRSEYVVAVKAADVAIAKLRSLGLDDLARTLDSELDDWRTAPVDRYDLAQAPLTGISARASDALTGYRVNLDNRLDALTAPTGDIERVRQLLDRNDEVTAEEFITKIKSGEPLPDVASIGRRGDFDEFFPAVVEHATDAAAQAGPQGSPEQVALQSIIDRFGGRQPTVGSLREGLSAWKQLYQLYYKRNREKGEVRFRDALADVLRMIGLNPIGDNNSFQDVTEAPRTRVATFEVRARPLDGSYVPQLGTQANGRYTVILVFERSTLPGRLLTHVPERNRTSANLILYFGLMDVDYRLGLRQHSIPTSGKGSPTLVIDEAVIGWLATRQEAGFRATQEVTLPFTPINPYTPFAGGDVPSEVFVGREREREAVERASGSMFVYGGRQLGKSALLRRIEKLYTEPLVRGRTGRRVALYLDLKSESIGEARKPEELWSLLIRPLSQLGVLPANQANLSPDRVSQGIAEWLDRDEANSLLLLLDEADMFLAADAVPNANGTGEFRTFQRLKNLMERYGRRFKPVFAGLHQVQRFYDLSNTPVAHGGADILIGPLRPLEVRELVERPMRAIGYEFESDDLVWRIAALTNYQASLVQIFCEALIDDLRRRPVRRPGRTVITSEDVDGVYANRVVRDLIAQRFRWTINLDTRYRVIALVVTVLSLDEGQPGSTFSIDDLRTFCAASWPEGFAESELTSKDFVRYLDEMVGLGVLHRGGEQYGIRSPNVVALLGTYKALDQELREASEHFELPYEYDPGKSRMMIGREWERSPLTDADLANLIGEREGTAHTQPRVVRVGRQYKVAVVSGTRALGVDRVGAVLEQMRIKHDLPLVATPLDDLRYRLGSETKSHRLLVVEIDHRPDTDLAGTLAEIVRLIGERRIVRVIVTAHVHTAEPLVVPTGDDFLHVRLSRWSLDALRAWHDFPFETVESRRKVHLLTSGWPMLLERAAEQVNSGRSTDDVLNGLRSPFATAEEAQQFLDDVGIDERLRPMARAWAENSRDPGDEPHMVPFTRADLEPVLGDAGPFLDRMRSLDAAQTSTDNGWVLDPVVAEALTVAG